MYRKRDRSQLCIEGFYLPFGGKLNADNRWVSLAELIPWDFIEDIYVQSMSENVGTTAISARIAFGAIFIKENEKLTDERTVENIAENPYMQYFLGLNEFVNKPLFDPSMMVHFRKRFPAEKLEEINKRIFAVPREDPSDDDPPRPNSGKLVLDATCAPADIRYPNDLSLLNEARENTETMIEELWPQSRRQGHKTRYSRRKARGQYLRIAKQKKPRRAQSRTTIRKQLHYLQCNLEDIGEMLTQLGLETLSEKRLERLLIVCKLHRQQSAMYRSKSRQCEERIVSLRQPHIRPLVRGKAGRRYEFGQKLALSVVNGYTFIERQRFENFNEGITLIESVERYKNMHGYYPEVVQADQLYRNRANLSYCKERGIRLSGPRLGRPGKDAERNREVEYRDRCERNIVEGRNGMAKRRFGLDLIMAYLPETALTEAALQVFCMNARIHLIAIFFRFSIWASCLPLDFLVLQ